MNKLIFRSEMNVRFMLMLLILAITGLLSMPAQATDDGTDYIESAYPLKISLDPDKLEGFIMYKLCRWDAEKKESRCKVERLPITPETIAYANYQKVPLRYARTRLGKYAEVVYDKDSLVVKSISW